VKTLGARWDSTQKKWYVPDHLPLEKFDPWIREYLFVPFNQKDVVKGLGAAWDFNCKRWYAKGRTNLSRFDQWRVIYLQVPSFEVNRALQMGARADGSQLYVPLQTKDLSAFRPWLSRLYLQVPLSDEDIVRSQGALWDNTKQKWFTHSGMMSEEFLDRYFHPSTPLPPPSSGFSPCAPLFPPSSSPSFKLLFFDVETTGLPLFQESLDFSEGWRGQRFPPASDLSAYDTARVVQLSYLTCDFPSSPSSTLSLHDSLIRCSGFVIENSHLHGITTERSLSEGVPLLSAMNEFLTACRSADFLVAHNLQFDYHVLLSELHRHGGLSHLIAELEARAGSSLLCTMELSRRYLQERHGVTPSLKNLFESVIGERLSGHHNSLEDVKNLHRATARLLELGEIRLRR
jgi:DNA polymerase III subunit epsilon